MPNAVPLYLPSCHIDSVTEDENVLWIVAHTTSSRCNCPNCGSRSYHVHSYYTRSMNDLPLFEKTVRLRLRIKRFRCLASGCRRRTFTEVIPGYLLAYARRTPRLTRALWHIGQVAGGQAGARLASCLGMPTTRHTLLRLLRQQPAIEVETLHVIGVDDWAKRRGQTYGTIVVDLERRRVVDLLPNRDATTLGTWLAGQTSIQIVARDRSSEFAQGITSGAPQAVQVADRWHLLKNLSETVERALQDMLPTLRKHAGGVSTPSGHPRPNFPRSQTEKANQQLSRERRLQDYTRVQYLKQRSFGIRRIARLLGLHQVTVSRYFKANQFPERESHYVASQLDSYLDYLEKRVAEGCMNGQQLWREICQLGYPGRPSQVTKWMQLKRRAMSGEAVQVTSPNRLPLPVSLPSPHLCRHVLMSKVDRLSEQDRIVLAQLQQVPVLNQLYVLAQAFVSMVRERQTDRLDPWLTAAGTSNIAACQHFAASIKQDYKAVKAALELPWSNGQTEGQVNRLKMLKRQMYGRANLDLLRIRLLYAPA